ncbi:hypothetical protein JOB18_027220 [Solea senegalensis]|uniref:Uncharacterized protein n=1 Tax=Solea senegalensis TaxID=28829 RepID=A0AAV6S4P8_SOLSE|nr:hypothetical protein JOB18_027220 [Solea senegalensis]
MNSGNSKDFLLTLSFPGYLKEPYYYFQPFAFGNFSVLSVLLWELAEQKRCHLQGKRRGVVVGELARVVLKLEGEWSSLAVVAARVSQV